MWVSGRAAPAPMSTCLRPLRLDRGCVERANRVDRVGVLWPLVGAVAFDSGKAQRQAARILRTGLDVVERHFDDELGADVDGPGIPADLTFEERGRLPGQHRVGHALERFP